MAVPGFQELTKPALELCSDGGEHPTRTLREELREKLALTQSDVAELLPSGTVR